MEERLDRMEKLLENLMNKNTIDINLFKTGVLCSMKKYIDTYYVKNKQGRVDTTQFHKSLREALKNDGYNLEIKNIPALMIYVFGFNKIKSDFWYYEGLTLKDDNLLQKPQEHITKLMIPKPKTIK